MSDMRLILERIGARLVTEIAPRLAGDYAAGHAAMSGLMAVMAGEAWDGAANRLVVEIRAVRDLLQQAGLGAQVPAASSVKISDLCVERDALNRLLITLQAQIETRKDPESRDLNAQIWQHYVTVAQARMPSPPQFPDAEAQEDAS